MVFSTHVEMFLSFTEMSFSRKRFSPRMWRCFQRVLVRFPYLLVFSTHVEMFLRDVPQERRHSGFLHACGDVSVTASMQVFLLKFSPRMWRCFRICKSYFAIYNVFSPHVEMFLISVAQAVNSGSFLHACGDVSFGDGKRSWTYKFSPRMWRCFP